MKRITIKQKIILVLFGLILSLVLLELGLRIAGFFSLATQTIPNTLFGLNEDKNTYTILAIGESTTAPLYNDRNWPRELEIILNNGSNNTKFKVISYGIPGSNTGYLLSSLRDNLVKYDPDMVITMMGINDKLFGIDYIYNESVKNQILLSFDDFRIFKLGKFIWQSLKNKFPNQNVEEIFWQSKDNSEYLKYVDLGYEYLDKGKVNLSIFFLNRAVELDPNSIEAYQILSLIFLDTKYRERISEIIDSSLNNNITNYKVYSLIGDIYNGPGMFSKAGLFLEKSIELNPDNHKTKLLLSNIYYNIGQTNKSKLYLEGIPINHSDYWMFQSLWSTNNRLNFSDNYTQKYKTMGFIKRDKQFSYEQTRYHYKKFYEILRENNVKYIAMQYPTLDINELKHMLNDTENVIYVSNKDNFETALKKHRYEELFLDNFAGKFGHTTFLGNRLIAENVARAIFNELSIQES